MSECTRVLIVEDLPSDAELAQREIAKALGACEFERVETREAFLGALDTFRPALIVSDFQLPEFDGLTALELAKSLVPDVPFIIVTGSMNEDTAVECMKAGAWDYVIKEHIKRLGTAVASALENQRARLERKRADKQILEQHATLSAILESTESSVFSLDRQYRYTTFNRIHAEVMKAIYGAEIRLGVSLAEYQTVPADWQTALKNLDRALAGEAFVESAFSGDEGRSRRYFEIAHYPIRTVAGEVIGVSVFSRDVTQRKRAEAERARLAAAIDQSAEMVVITDTAGAIQYVNPAFESTTGYSRAEVLGKNPRLLKSGRQDAAFYRALWDTISSGKAWHGRFVNARKDGTHYTEEATVSPVRDAAGEIASYVAVKRNITHELDLQAQVFTAQRMESVGRLAGGIAHDFNNIVTVILAFNGFVLAGVAEDDARRGDLLEVEKAAQRAATLTRQLLAFSRKQILQPAALDLSQSVAQMEKMLRRVIGEDVELVNDLAADLGTVKADPGQIEQVIMNLVVNARDAMLTGGKLTITTANAELVDADASQHVDVKAGRYVLLSIEDTGSGMDASTQARLFEPFFTTKEKGKGTGLGLSTVYGIVKQSDGHIWVDSEPGKGTAFRIYFPRVEATPVPEVRPATLVARPTGTETILLVEDDEPVRNLAKRILTQAGYTVLAAASGAAALQACESHAGSVHLLLTDVVMPQMGGKVLAERLAGRYPGLKVLYMSGYTDDAIVHHGILDPGTHLIGKPFSAAELTRKVRETIDGVRSGGSVGASEAMP